MIYKKPSKIVSICKGCRFLTIYLSKMLWRKCSKKVDLHLI